MTTPCPNISISWIREDGSLDVINHFMEKLFSFFIAWPDSGRDGIFDRWSKSEDNRPDEITEADISAANTLVARTSWGKYWAKEARALSRLLADLPTDQDLFDQGVWEEHREALEAIYKRAMAVPGIGYASATKVLHLKRPKLVPICDSVVISRLNVTSTPSPPDAAMKCTEMILRIGRKNRAELARARAYLPNAPLPRPDRPNGPPNAYHDLTEVRILDMVLWTDTTSYDYWPLFGWD